MKKLWGRCRSKFYLCLMVFIAGCGQKGDLYLPPPTKAPPAEAATQATTNVTAQGPGESVRNVTSGRAIRRIERAATRGSVS